MFSFRKHTRDEPLTHIGTGVNMEHPTKIVPLSIPDSYRKRHMFVFGTTGVGKTRLCENLIEQDINKGYSVVYFDPKGDQQIFTKIFEVARNAGRLDELMLVTPIFPEYSSVVDPMAFYFMIDELVGHIISGIQGGKEPFYRNIAKEITTAVITANILLATEEGRLPVMNIDTIRQSIRRDALEETMNALRRIGSREADLTAGMLEDILKSPMEYYAKVSSTLRTALMELSSGNIGKIIGQADSNRFIKRLEEGKRVILVVHTGTMITREAAATLGKVLLSMIQSFIGRVYLSNKQKVDPPLSVYIDEAQSLFYQGVEDLFAKAGSADVMVTAFAQSVNQVYAVVGEEFGKSILDNTNTKIFMRCSDAETSEYVVKHFGVRNVLTGIFGSNQVTTREVEQDILKVQDILGLQPREFYMLTYSGRFKGTTLNAPNPKLKIIFPEAPAVVSSFNDCRSQEETDNP
ncbi:MAG: type IV secretion system DNA-binding domain-containing protein [Geobacter sp.]|nr:type IV secretion system DNA-binding domain-containing protein [Geobacter sp.]